MNEYNNKLMCDVKLLIFIIWDWLLIFVSLLNKFFLERKINVTWKKWCEKNLNNTMRFQFIFLNFQIIERYFFFSSKNNIFAWIIILLYLPLFAEIVSFDSRRRLSRIMYVNRNKQLINLELLVSKQFFLFSCISYLLEIYTFFLIARSTLRKHQNVRYKKNL